MVPFQHLLQHVSLSQVQMVMQPVDLPSVKQQELAYVRSCCNQHCELSQLQQASTESVPIPYHLHSHPGMAALSHVSVLFALVDSSERVCNGCVHPVCFGGGG